MARCACTAYMRICQAGCHAVDVGWVLAYPVHSLALAQKHAVLSLFYGTL